MKPKNPRVRFKPVVAIEEIISKKGKSESQQTVQTLKNRVEKIRAKSGDHRLNESLAREFVARILVVPVAKHFFGKGLRSVCLIGSSQAGVRQSNSHRAKSDLDIMFHFAPKSYQEAQEMVALCGKLDKALNQITQQFGIKIELIGWHQRYLERVERNYGKPLQVLYGDKFVFDRLGEEYRTKNKELKEKSRQQNRD